MLAMAESELDTRLTTVLRSGSSPQDKIYEPVNPQALENHQMIIELFKTTLDSADWPADDKAEPQPFQGSIAERGILEFGSKRSRAMYGEDARLSSSNKRHET